MRRRAELAAIVVSVLAGATLFGGCAASRTESGAASGAAAHTGDTPPRKLPSPTGKCIFLDTINDWKAVDPYHILVRTRATGWQWKVTLTRRCANILYANALAWDTVDTRVCDSRADAITVPRDRCPIGSIEPYDEPPEVKSKPAGGGW